MKKEGNNVLCFVFMMTEADLSEPDVLYTSSSPSSMTLLSLNADSIIVLSLEAKKMLSFTVV